jgi:hypothetical protein
MIFALTGIGVRILSTVEVDESFTEFPFSTYSISFRANDIIRLATAFEDDLLARLQMLGEPAERGCYARRSNENRLVKFIDPAIAQDPRSIMIFHVKHRASRKVVSACVYLSGRGSRRCVVRVGFPEESYRAAPVEPRVTPTPKKLIPSEGMLVGRILATDSKTAMLP